MKCYKCGKDIDLEMTPDEEESLDKEMKEHGVIMICIECSDVKYVIDIEE